MELPFLNDNGPHAGLDEALKGEGGDLLVEIGPVSGGDVFLKAAHGMLLLSNLVSLILFLSMTVNSPQYYRLLRRLQNVAELEASTMLKALPSEFKDRAAVMALRLDDRPSKAMIDRGIDPDILALTDGEAEKTHIFLMNLHDRYGKLPGDFRHELRRCLAQELSDWVGMEVDLAE